MTIVLDNIIYSLQKRGGVSSYWSELRNRIYNYENINIVELGPKKYKFHFLNKVLLLLFEKYSRIELNNITDNCVFHSSYYRALNSSSKKNNIKEIVTVHDFTYELFSSGLKK
jgi:mannosyltransferase